MRPRTAFSLIEVLVAIAIIAVLLALLLPTLIYTRDAARTAVCAANLKQVGMAWSQYLDDFQVFPQHELSPDWNYGGVHFLGSTPFLASDRPINRYLADERESESRPIALLYRCPSDRGVYERGGSPKQPGGSVLNGRTCFETFGTSYRANPYLLDAALAGIEPRHRPLKRHEVWVAESRLLTIADAAWYYSTRPEKDPQSRLDATWHHAPDSGNMLAADGSVRFTSFERGEVDRYSILPRPGAGPK
jgi:prepilin-type N-terminal cleavage/methylation domain-containing protein